MSEENSKPAEEVKLTCSQKCGYALERFQKFLWNPETREFMGRTGCSWAKIGLFYLIFYGFLAGFFAGMLAIFMTTVNQPEDGGPKLTQFIKNQPGLTRLDQSKNRLNSKYNSSNATYVQEYAKFVDKFLNNYNTSEHEQKLCNSSSEEGMPKDSSCIFDRTLLGPCDGVTDTAFGLDVRSPCIFLKINKVYDWIPKSSDGSGYLELSCSEGTVTPKGFLISAFPFRGQKWYQSPVVSVKVDTSDGKTHPVQCTLKGKDIEVSETFKASRAFGKIQFEVSSM